MRPDSDVFLNADSKNNYVHALKVGFEGIKFGPGKYGELSAALTVYLTMACVDLNKRRVVHSGTSF